MNRFIVFFLALALASLALEAQADWRDGWLETNKCWPLGFLNNQPALDAAVSQAKQYLEDVQAKDRSAMRKSELEKLPSVGEVQDLLEASEIDESKCKERSLRKLNELVKLSHNTRWKTDLRPYTFHCLREQVMLCWPEFSRKLNSAVRQLPAEILEDATNMTRAMIPGMDTHWWGFIDSYDYQLKDNTGFVSMYRRFLLSDCVPKGGSLGSKFKRLIKGGEKFNVKQHVQSICGPISEKVGPIATALDLSHLNSCIQNGSEEFVAEWLLKGRLCSRMMEEFSKGLAERVTLQKSIGGSGGWTTTGDSSGGRNGGSGGGSAMYIAAANL